MQKVPLTRVSVGELNKKIGSVLDRVMRGERFIVCRHRRPIATLQPLTGSVVQPFEGTQYDVVGSPLGDASAEVDKLSPLQQAMLLDAITLGRIVPGRVAGSDRHAEIKAAFEDLILRGLARKGSRGIVITGRGMVLREELFARHGRTECDWFR